MFRWSLLLLAVVGCASGQSASATCGNGQAEAAEVCDGADLRGASCGSLGLGAGLLQCEASCGAYATGGCAASLSICGNGAVEAPEVCDGADLAGATCESRGFRGGTMRCAPGCALLDTSGCTTAGETDAGGSGGPSDAAAPLDPGGASDAATTAVPPEWTCADGYYGTADGCDCGCGALDPDCADATVGSCAYCGDAGSCATGGCPANIDPAQNWLCSGDPGGGGGDPPPAEWTCPAGYYGTGDGCDCGCGVLDPDCADATVGACGWCDDAGSCGTGACPANIDPAENWRCVSAGPVPG